MIGFLSYIIHADDINIFQCMEEAGVDGALIVQPINHKFDHSYVTRYVQLLYFLFFSPICLM